MVGGQEKHSDCGYTCAYCPKGSLPKQVEEGRQWSNRITEVHLANGRETEVVVVVMMTVVVQSQYRQHIHLRTNLLGLLFFEWLMNSFITSAVQLLRYRYRMQMQLCEQNNSRTYLDGPLQKLVHVFR